MNWRGFRAVVRLELLRGRRLILWGGGLLLLMLVLSVVLPHKLGLIAGVFALPVAMALGMAPLGTLATDKMQGNLEFDRTLPLSLRTIASARMLGATLRTAPAILGVVALGMAVAGDRPMVAPLVIGVALTAMLAGWWLLWVLLGLNARFSMRRLWWLPLSLWLIPSLVPEPVLARLGSAIETFGGSALGQLEERVGLMVLLSVGAVVVLTLVLFGGSVALFASGLARYRPDPAALGIPLGAAPKLELAAIGRGPVVAVIRLRLRLALEQFRRELVIIAAMLVVILFDLEPIADYARLYLPILAALIPSGIAFHLMAGRATGALEGLQQLPHPRRVIGIGHLIAVLTMALPGVLVIAVARAMEGAPMDFPAIVTRWLWYVTLGWCGVVLAVWGTRRRLLIGAIVIAAILVVLWFLAPGTSFTDTLLDLIANAKSIRETAGLWLPVGAALLTAVLGLELFARGLATLRPGDR